MAEITRISRAYKDISLSFLPNPVTNDISVIKNERAIKKSIRNIVQTIPGEKFFLLELGSSIREELFDLFDAFTATSIEDEIRTSILNWEPRVNNVRVAVNAIPDSNSLEVGVEYNIVGEEFPPQNYTFILEATR